MHLEGRCAPGLTVLVEEEAPPSSWEALELAQEAAILGHRGLGLGLSGEPVHPQSEGPAVLEAWHSLQKHCPPWGLLALTV